MKVGFVQKPHQVGILFTDYLKAVFFQYRFNERKRGKNGTADPIRADSSTDFNHSLRLRFFSE